MTVVASYTEKKRMLTSAMLSGAVWLLLLIAFIFIPLKVRLSETREFEPIEIRFTAQETYVRTSPEAMPAEGQAQAEPAPATPAKPLPTAKPVPAAKPAPASTGLGIPDFAAPVTSSNQSRQTAESLDFSSTRQTERPAEESKPRGGQPIQELEGEVARTVSPSSASTVTARGTAPSAGAASSASADTTRALSGIQGATAPGQDSATASSAQASSSRTGTATASSVSSITGLSFEGIARKLISPSNPQIVLPDRVSSLVNSNTRVTVSFTVRKDGGVPRSGIGFTPSAAIHPDIQEFLRNEFSSWRFEAGDQDGQASFSYSIRVQ